MTDQFSVEWVDSGMEPKCPPNPDYPTGVDIDGIRPGERACKVDLPYPAKRRGVYVIKCGKCMGVIAVTTAGRPDDPRSVRVPCRTYGSPRHD